MKINKMTEEGFLTALVAENMVFDMYLHSGIKLSNMRLEAFDMDALFVSSTDHRSGCQMIYKACVSTLRPFLRSQKLDNMRTLNDVISDLVDRAEFLAE